MTTMADNKDKKVLKSSIERELSQTCLNSAEREKIKGSTNLNVPHLRFPEFSGEWESARLSSFAKKITKKNKGNTISNILCNSANFGIIPQSEYFDRDIANSENTDTYYIVESGDFVYNPRKSVTSPYGPVNMYKGKNLGIISPLYLCFSVKGISKEYLLNWFKGNKWYRYVYSHGDMGVRYDRVSIKDDIFFHMPINVPNIDEQEKISKILNLIDKRIATQNKIIEDLKLLKSAITDRLYSELRGTAYTYRQLFDVINERNKDNIYHNVLSASQELGMIDRSDINIDIKFEQASIVSYKIVRKGDYVVHLRSFQGGFAFSEKTGICSPAYTILRPKDNLMYGYLSHYFTSKQFVKSLNLVTYGIRDGRSINVDEWLDMKVVIPEKQKQLHILTTINSIEFKLRNEQKIYTRLIKQKSYLLRQMFI